MQCQLRNAPNDALSEYINQCDIKIVAARPSNLPSYRQYKTRLKRTSTCNCLPGARASEVGLKYCSYVPNGWAIAVFSGLDERIPKFLRSQNVSGNFNRDSGYTC